MRASYAPLKYVVEVQTSVGSRGASFDLIAAFDAQKIAVDYCNACGATGSADLYRVSLRSGLSWVVIHTAGRSALSAAVLHHPQAVKSNAKPAQVSA